MIQILISIIGILITIFFVIGTHEYAHYKTARLLGVKVLRFSIGFGKRLFHWHDKQGTEYVFALIPLGGYVKMLDEGEGIVPPDQLPYAYNRQPFYKKFLIVLAGPAMNLFCALVLYWIIYTVGYVTPKPLIGEITPHSIAAESGLKGNEEITHVDGQPTSNWSSILFRIIAHAGNKDTLKITTVDNATKANKTYSLDLTTWQLNGLTPDPLASLGIKPFEPTIPLVVGKVAEDSPAAMAGFKTGDKILTINNKPIQNWKDVISFTADHPGEAATITIERNKKTLSLPVTIGTKKHLFWHSSGYLGIAPHFTWPQALMHKVQYSPLAAIPRAFQEIVDFTYFNFLIFGKMITGKISLQSLGGPITIFESAGDALNYGFLAFIGFLAFLSISIGVINLLPIPGLDGGHLLIQTIEAIRGKPVPDTALLLMYRLGFILLIFVLIQALVNDFLRLH